jgi:flagellar biogenesis protein FliO
MLLSVGSSLLIVIGLFLGVAWFARKTMNTTFGGLPKQVVSVLGRTPLAPRQQLVLVRFGSKLVLVSMIQGEARTISEITDPLEVDQLAGLCESSQPGSITNSFRSILQQSGGGAV